MWFTRVASQASVVNGLALALAFYWPCARDRHAARRCSSPASPLALTWINIRGIKQSSWVVNALTIGKLAAAVPLHPRRHLVHRSGALHRPCPPSSRSRSGTAALLLIFAYGGYEVTGVPAGEAANPRRDVPFAFVRRS